MTPAQRDNLMALVMRYGKESRCLGRANASNDNAAIHAAEGVACEALDAIIDTLSALTDWTGATLDVEDAGPHPLAPFCAKCGEQKSRFGHSCPEAAR